jgi:hypothetical protein
MMKNNLLAFLAVSIVLSPTTLYAAKAITPADTSANTNQFVSVPNLKPGFEYNIAALWLQAGASNLNYVIYNKALPAQSPSWNEQELQPSFATAFALGIRYIFSNTKGTDVNLNWTHLDSTTSSSIAADNATYFLGPDYEIGPAGIPIRNATGKATFRYDVVNVDIGQFVQFGQFVDMRFFGGLSTGFLRENVSSTYSGNTGGTYAGPFNVNQQVTSNFTGVGPRAGIHADISTNSAFGFIGEAAASALIGSLYSKTSYTSSAQQLLVLFGQTSNYQTIIDQSVHQIIPGFDAKLGITYRHVFANNAIFTTTAGYQAAVYINAISQYLPSTLVAGQPLESGGIFVATMSHRLSNYSVQGPFLNFALQI